MLREFIHERLPSDFSALCRVVCGVWQKLRPVNFGPLSHSATVQSTDVTDTSQYNASASYWSTETLCTIQMATLKLEGLNLTLSLTNQHIVATYSGGGFIPSINSELHH
jgi:hypothetical protein